METRTAKNRLRKKGRESGKTRLTIENERDKEDSEFQNPRSHPELTITISFTYSYLMQ